MQRRTNFVSEKDMAAADAASTALAAATAAYGRGEGSVRGLARRHRVDVVTLLETIESQGVTRPPPAAAQGAAARVAAALLAHGGRLPLPRSVVVEQGEMIATQDGLRR